MDVDEEGQAHLEEEDGGEPEVDVGRIETVLSVVWGAGKLGAAYYNLQTSELFLLPDTVDSLSDFEVVRALFKQVSPKIVIGCSRQDARFLAILKELSGDLFPEDRSQEPTPRSGSTTVGFENQRPNLFIQPGREFAPDPCKHRLRELRLPDEPKSSSDEEHRFFLQSLIPFANIAMVRAAGALLKFLDKRGLELLQVSTVNGKVPVLNVKTCTMADLVLVDHTAWDSLQIFNQDVHPSVAKQGSSGTKEGLSLFCLFNRCLTSQGSNHLRLQLLRPTRNLGLLKRRHDVIEHCVSAAQAGFVESVTSFLKGIKHLPKLLLRLSLLHATVKEWKQLYQTLHNCILLGEICSSQPSSIDLFKEISDVCKNDIVLGSVAREICRVIDFEQSNVHRRFYPQPGINEELDRKRQQYGSLKEVMSMIAAEEMDSLPPFAEQCCIVYIPEVGYLLAIKLWGSNLTDEDMILEGLEYKFRSSDLGYYKSKRTEELNNVLGDSQVAILELESYVMISLTENVMRTSIVLLKINSLISELDSLMTLAALAREQKFVRPEIVSSTGKLRILDGRHPLIELNSNFVQNSTIFGEEERIVILTGPNASGKSIYLKQVGIIVIMALCGSFVPATSAVIPAFDRICTRIHAHESVTVGLSTFMLDINQMSLAQRNATGGSLVILDEFGKGTSEADGLSLLMATLEDFGQRGKDSPTMFVSTHYYSLLNRLPVWPIFKSQTMDFLMENDELVYLFKLKDGKCTTGFAYLVAKDTGTPQETLARSAKIENVLRHDEPESSIEALNFQEEKESTMIAVAEDFLKLRLNEIDVAAYLGMVRSLLEPFMGTDTEAPIPGPASSAYHTPSSSSSGGVNPEPMEPQ